MTAEFEIGASVTLTGDDLQFVGVASARRIKFILTNAAIKRLAKSGDELTQQQKFKTYDRSRTWIHEMAKRIYDLGPTKGAVKIGALDV